MLLSKARERHIIGNTIPENMAMAEKRLEELSEVTTICDRIARDIRHQYTIGYVPTNPIRDGTYRAIRVVARGKDHDRLSLRTRTGYFTTAGAPGLENNGAR